MHFGEIKKRDIANGIGVRVSIFVSGCRNCCPNCFNRDTWAFDYGSLYTKDTENEILEALSPDYITGLSILGGEPFEPENQLELINLICAVKKLYPNKTVWCYTGFTLEELYSKNCRANTEYTDRLVSLIDILVDGRFIEELKNISLQFRGSENQRVIDLKKTRASGEIVIWEQLKR